MIVVDDDSFTRSMIAGALQMQGLDVIGEAASVSNAMRLIEQLKPEAAVIDLDLGEGPNGFDLATGIRRKLPKIGLVILTTYEDPRLLRTNINLPPAGTEYLIKKNVTDIDILYKAIMKSIANAADLKNLEHLDKRKIYSLLNITDSQLETMRLVAQGLSNSEIAKMKSITEKSVEQSISRLTSHLDIPLGPASNQRVQISKLYYKLTGSNSTDAAK